ncbi:MAG: acetate--CoA ligase [Nitrospinae bacterium RIFCSPLOWO2_02_FULL_39_110]|nr:MAG: acetate--CoA ligase [Nitrospinae bacterium RIFCSPHIGHO2_02_39_11]OGV99761.1 MAG: acetate--CoA ligase [Nitrospinae bacterium RIFCSPHIGHO2_02_FULL_39_82]OGW00078.1 MAG: acetate--CoA ligase [Nitrospinae bacterium RIFCSPHIGHO2_12_FULL_39_42]OGW02046.1 MAG: acetate--CoA ligase [Nitrospinae bacterium RIFCSPLOWO2_02_39_17]OGW05505.1 MAG: acetate--CoA ligase [Nitrospinae bacterium RIFCSPLOWO2_02_FULL_39_110]OGW10912.1 MAG: acetate--CoA ligase [Nitrospinae bacterium RIFCSPLOWO2_12_39_15]OGW111
MSKEGIDVLLAEKRVFPPSREFSKKAHIKSIEEYEELYKRSVEDPEGFWSEIAERELIWFKKWDRVLNYNFKNPKVKWFINGKLNASYNCLDRFINTPIRNKAALIWESDDGSYRTYTYQQLYYEVNRFANVLKKYGVEKGDRVTIYLPMIPELPISMLACARIGAIHSVVFGGFSAQSLRNRIQDCRAKLLITADRGVRGGRLIPIKANVDEALTECPTVERLIVVKRTDGVVDMEAGRDLWWHDEINKEDVSNYCEPEWMDAEDPLFILYTSGSTGRPKGVLHTTGGYLVFTNITFKWVFDYHDEDIHFCTADIGWVTGHSYIVYGPLSNGATSLMFEGIPIYPHPGRFWEIVDKHRVNIFYTAPTAIRALMREGEGFVTGYDLSSLRVLGTVGEPINPEAWMWYHTHVGKGKLPIVDTWWQTETGGILITPLPGAMTLKPGSANKPLPGIVPAILREDGSPTEVNEGGYLVIEKPWPGMIRGTYGDLENQQVKEVYFSKFPGRYLTGDGAKIDEDGDYWLMGRIDDVVNVSGHRLGTAEIESALASHNAVAEAAAVGFPHEIKGEGIYTYVILKDGHSPSDDLKRTLTGHVRSVIGPIAIPDKLQFVSGLPKTRSGKIMRRILRKIAWGDVHDLGDTSTLADPSVVDELLKGKL